MNPIFASDTIPVGLLPEEINQKFFVDVTISEEYMHIDAWAQMHVTPVQKELHTPWSMQQVFENSVPIELQHLAGKMDWPSNNCKDIAQAL